MTENDELCFKLMDKCHICGEKYTDKDVRVRDHRLQIHGKDACSSFSVIFKPLKMTENDELCFKLMDKCHICGEKYTDKDVRVRDHCHVTGRFRGSAHQECNLKLRIKPEDIKIPIIFHNLRGYDSHFIMQQIGEIAKNHAYKNKKRKEQPLKINVIPNNMEKYMAFMLGKHPVFLDSF